MPRALVWAITAALLGAASFSSIAAVAHGGWSPLEAGVIGFWAGAAVGGFFGVVPGV